MATANVRSDNDMKFVSTASAWNAAPRNFEAYACSVTYDDRVRTYDLIQLRTLEIFSPSL